MSILDPLKRPVIHFEVENKQHRALFVDFMERQSWANSPVLFAVEKPYTDVISMISSKMMKHYITQEFESKGI